jgi:hypothetical protein
MRGKSRFGKKALLELAVDAGVIPDMSSTTPILDYMKQVALDPTMRAEVRIAAGTPLLKFESHAKATKPWIPVIPPDLKLPRLSSVAACQESLATITEAVLSGLLTPDAGDYLRKHVEAVLPSLQESELKAEVQALRGVHRPSRGATHTNLGSGRRTRDAG